ncbi:hypothetical protein GGR56DRAFT_655382 [Xylariaceae sp. FL0804]|nr:hypothetical protein GGR56DRAFT_655382 [Xylariaceae sp. FL0804]
MKGRHGWALGAGSLVLRLVHPVLNACLAAYWIHTWQPPPPYRTDATTVCTHLNLLTCSFNTNAHQSRTAQK